MRKVEIYNEAIAAVILVNGLDMCERVEIIEELIEQKRLAVFAEKKTVNRSDAV